MEDWGNFLHQILEEDSEDSALIKVFLLVWGSNGKQRRLTVATDGLGWWKNEVLGFGWRFGEEESEKSCFSR